MSTSYLPAEIRYSGASYRRCGRSGLRLPPVSLGLWQHCHDVELVRALVRAGFDRGMTHLDLANNYGPPPGAAEACLGRVLAEDLKPYRDELVISTKAGWDMWEGPYGDFGSRKYLIASLDQSLQRMGLDYVDIFYHHRPDPDTPLEETIGALADLVRQGKALYAGISNYSGERICEAAAIATDLKVPLIINQVKYNMLTRDPEQTVLDQSAACGQGVIAFSPLEHGLLSDRYLDGIPENSRAAKGINNLGKRLSDELLAKLRKLNTIAQDRGQTLAQLALTWVLRHDEIVSVITGASKVSQLEQTLDVANAAPLSDDQLAAIDGVLG